MSSSKTSNKPAYAGSGGGGGGKSLSSAVSELVRAAIGGNHANVPDEDLDKYVAEQILKSAAESEKRYKTVGLDAYLVQKDQAKLSSGTVVNK
ncbi:hypothetical protein BGW41_003419 [Actinomortierella wolfii]|nr:hypothetical protein BGW41_003419 [Actinomortierella wolfii]